MEYEKCVKRLKKLGEYDKWRHNIDDQMTQESFKGFKSNDFSSFNQFIDYSFTWEDTFEGHEYWESIHRESIAYDKQRT
jgi:hypothetical protein